MKIFKLMAIALVAMLGFTACDKDCDHEFIEHDHSADLVGTWTCLTENYAEALIIKADGTAVSYGVEDGKYWENVKGTVTVKENNITMIFEDDDNWTGHFDVIPGMAFSLFEENGERYIYQYCANDLSDEIVGMWVCTYVPWMEADMAINVYQADGKAFFTGFVGDADFDYASNVETTYKVIGDLMFQSNPMSYEGAPKYLAFRMDYSPNGSEYGDVLTNTNLMVFGDEVVETTASMIRVKQGLNLTGKTYDYSSAYVTNAKGKDEDFSILGHTFNIAKIGAGDFDMMLRSVLFCLDTDANSIKQHFLVDGVEGNIETPIAVDGNKVTIDYSDVNHALRKVEMYMYQDADDSQLHMYMHTDAFINYFANLEVVTLLQAGKINQSDAAAVEKVFTDMEARVESINVSFVLKAAK